MRSGTGCLWMVIALFAIFFVAFVGHCLGCDRHAMTPSSFTAS